MEPSHGMITVAPPLFASLGGEEEEPFLLTPRVSERGRWIGAEA